MPSIFGLAEEQGVTWRAYTGRGRGDPTRMYTQLRGSANVVATRRFVADAAGGELPRPCDVWHATPENEHPPQDVTKGMDGVWRAVDAVVRGGGWQDTVFMLTYDDWGGYDDHARTPATEYTPDNVQLAFGPRVPLIMFGARVRPGIDHRWCSHASVLKTVLQLLAMPALGVARADSDPGLADRVQPTPTRPPTPPPGAPIQIEPAPVAAPPPHATAPAARAGPPSPSHPSSSETAARCPRPTTSSCPTSPTHRAPARHQTERGTAEPGLRKASIRGFGPRYGGAPRPWLV